MSTTLKALATLQTDFREAMVETVTFYPTTDSWTLVQRTQHGPNTINCRSADLPNALERLTASMVR